MCHYSKKSNVTEIQALDTIIFLCDFATHEILQ